MKKKNPPLEKAINEIISQDPKLQKMMDIKEEENQEEAIKEVEKMMNEDLMRLNHIMTCVNRMKKVIHQCSLEKFLENFAIQDVILREFQVIGMAVKKISKELKEEFSEMPWEACINFSDQISEVYSFDMELMWRIAKKDVPRLEKDIKNVLSLFAEE